MRLGITIPENANSIRNIMQLNLQIHDHIVHFYHLHALDWVNPVNALKADPKATSELQQAVSPSASTFFAGLFPRCAESAQVFRGSQANSASSRTATGITPPTCCRLKPISWRRRTILRRSTCRKISSRSIRSSAARTRIRTGWWAACLARSTCTRLVRSVQSIWSG